MSWFGPKLEPGETVIRRYPPLLYGWVLVAIVVVGLAGIFLIDSVLVEGAETIFLIVIVPVIPFVLIAGYLGSRWRILVTNKRILARLGMASLSGMALIHRAEIEQVYSGATGVEELHGVRSDDNRANPCFP